MSTIGDKKRFEKGPTPATESQTRGKGQCPLAKVGNFGYEQAKDKPFRPSAGEWCVVANKDTERMSLHRHDPRFRSVYGTSLQNCFVGQVVGCHLTSNQARFTFPFSVDDFDRSETGHPGITASAGSFLGI